MNREIKFRAWRENKMYYNITTAHYEHNAMSGSGGDLWDFAEWMKWSKVMQYTGLKDKNGVEIYEGDILAADHDGGEGEANIGVVFHAAGTFMIDGNGPFYDHVYGISPNVLDSHSVIGNKFENPELLEK